VFLGLSAGGVLKKEMVAKMGPKPLILAPPIRRRRSCPRRSRRCRDDAVIATGRSDYPNQVNNVLCFRSSSAARLDVGATTINEAMKLASVHAIADLAHAEQSDLVALAYGTENVSFGPEYLIPRPRSIRGLIVKIAPPWRRPAMDSGRRDRSHQGLPRVRAAAERVRLPLRPRDEADLRGREAVAAAHRPSRRARTSACCARPRS
jgi:malate dehydrogenase (oxaloacetate-decarboxylating)(NADP+)